jgi:anti-anti-sigma factor
MDIEPSKGLFLMAVKASQTLEEVCVSVDGELDLSTIGPFKSAVSKAFEMLVGKKLVFDLRQTEYIDSAGLEQLLVANRKMMALGERLIVRVKPNSQPHTVLNVAGFGTVMDVEPVADDGSC